MTVHSYEEFYLQNALGDEMYAKEFQNNEIFANSSKEQIYARDRFDNEYYPKMVNGKEIVAQTADSFHYAKKASNKEFYPKFLGDEYALKISDKLRYIEEPDGTIIYPLNKNDRPIYPVNEQIGSEMYVKNANGIPIIGKDSNGVYVYATDWNGDEFYPEGDIIAIDEFNYPVYALTKNGKVIYKTNINGDEYYFVDPRQFNDVLYVRDRELDRYTKNWIGDEEYPYYVTDTMGLTQVLLNDTYAVTHSGTVLYPLDEYGNEYTIFSEDEKIMFPIGYPITNDNKVIVPASEEEMEPYLSDTMIPPVEANDIVGQLMTNDGIYWDYITNITATRQSRSRRMEYLTRPIEFKMIPPPSIPVRNKINWSIGLLITTLVLVTLVFLYNFLFAKKIVGHKQHVI